MLCVVKLDACDETSRTDSRDTALRGKNIDPEGCIMHHLNEDEAWEVSKRKRMATGSCTFLEEKDLPFNFRHVLVCSCKVGMYAHCGEFSTHGDKFSIHQSGGDLEATLGVNI